MHLNKPVYYYFNINTICFQLCDVCRSRAARSTIKELDVIQVLGKLGTDFCAFMSDDIFTQNTRQTIASTKNDAEALGLIREVSR